MDSFEVAGKRWNESYMARVNIWGGGRG
jgi:hypothetical protein